MQGAHALRRKSSDVMEGQARDSLRADVLSRASRREARQQLIGCPACRPTIHRDQPACLPKAHWKSWS